MLELIVKDDWPFSISGSLDHCGLLMMSGPSSFGTSKSGERIVA